MERTGNTLGARLAAARGRMTMDEAIAAYRQRWGKSRGLSRGSLGRWENDVGRPSLVVLVRLATIYGTHVRELDADTHDELVELAGFMSRGIRTPIRHKGPKRSRESLPIAS